METQLSIDGFEKESLYSQAKRYLNINGAEKTIDFLREQKFHWLTDYNSGTLLRETLTGEKTSEVHEAYIPYRIEFPNHGILDENEIYKDLSELEKLGFSKDFVLVARILDECVNAEETNKDSYKFCNDSFISEKDEIETLKKYFEKPYFS